MEAKYSLVLWYANITLTLSSVCESVVSLDDAKQMIICTCHKNTGNFQLVLQYLYTTIVFRNLGSIC